MNVCVLNLSLRNCFLQLLYTYAFDVIFYQTANEDLSFSLSDIFTITNFIITYLNIDAALSQRAEYKIPKALFAWDTLLSKRDIKDTFFTTLYTQRKLHVYL